MIEKKVQINFSWYPILKNEFEKPYFIALKGFLRHEKKTQLLFPAGKNIFAAFDKCPFESVKVVIIGQDPYHGDGQANGLCFSVEDGISSPPSLKNIYKEMCSDIQCKYPKSGNLEKWAQQGVFLLNSTLTVRKSQPGSHQNKGWEIFTDSVIKILSEQKSNLVFILWGRFAQGKAKIIDEKKHLILKSPHPSPFSAYSGFFGCKHFSKTNEYLQQQNKDVIKWEL